MGMDLNAPVSEATLKNATTFYLGQIASMMAVDKVTKESVDGTLTRDVPAVIYIYHDNVPRRQTSNFILAGITRQRAEKVQVMETFGSPSVFFFGERTKIYTMQGYVLDSNSDVTNKDYQYEWSAQLQYFYDHYLAGSILASKEEKAVLKANGLSITGYPIQLTFSKTADMADYQQFNMTWIVESDIPEKLLSSQDPLTYKFTGHTDDIITQYNTALATGDKNKLKEFFEKLSLTMTQQDLTPHTINFA